MLHIGERRGDLEKIRERRNMGQIAPPRTQWRWRPPRLVHAISLSLAIHALLGLSLWALPGLHTVIGEHAPLAEIPIIVVPVEQFSLSLAPEQAYPPAKTDMAKPEPETELLPIRVEALAASVAPIPSTLSEPPKVQGAARLASSLNGGTPDGDGSRAGVPNFFGTPARGQKVVFLIDRSISMGFNGGLDAAKRELLACLDALPPTSRFQAVFYNRSIETLPSTDRDRLLAASPNTRQQAARFVELLRPAGSTDHLSAIRKALAFRPDVLFLVTDGDDLTHDHVRVLTQLNGNRTVIHTIECTPQKPDSDALMLLAHLNRGTYRARVTGAGYPIRVRSDVK
jgi:hypothetical protein